MKILALCIITFALQACMSVHPPPDYNAIARHNIQVNEANKVLGRQPPRELPNYRKSDYDKFPF